MKRLLFIAIILFSLNTAATNVEQTREKRASKTERPKGLNILRASVAVTEKPLLLDSIVEKETNGTYSHKFKYEYNTKGNISSYIGCNWDNAAGVWVNDFKYKYEYDANGNETLYVSYLDTDLNDWKKYYKYEYKYDDKNNTTRLVISDWDDDLNDWEKSYKYEYEYNDKDKQTQEAVFSWDIDLNDWVEGYKLKSEYEYDDKDKVTQRVDSYWDISLNDWTENHKLKYEYNDKDKLTLEVSSYWNIDLNDWEKAYRYEYEYDAKGNETLCAGYNWEYDADDWEKTYKYEHEYDANNNISIERYYDGMGNEWQYNMTSTYYYSLHSVSGINDTKADKIIIHSSENGIIITGATEGETIQVYNISGILIVQTRIETQALRLYASVEMEIALPKGIYIVRVGTNTFKIVKN